MVFIMVDFTRFFLEQSGLVPKEEDSKLKDMCPRCGLTLASPTISFVEGGKSTAIHLGCALRPILE